MTVSTIIGASGQLWNQNKCIENDERAPYKDC